MPEQKKQMCHLLERRHVYMRVLRERVPEHEAKYDFGNGLQTSEAVISSKCRDNMSIL